MFPGADDNASGVAVLLELAAYCRNNPFRRSIVFAAFDAEEGGLSGARAFVAKPPIAKDRIALNVNLDMVSRSDKREIYIAGTYHTPDLKAPLEQVAKTARVKVLFGHDRPGTGQRRLDQSVRSRRLPCGENSVSCISASKITPITTSRPTRPTRSTAVSSSTWRKPFSTPSSPWTRLGSLWISCYSMRSRPAGRDDAARIAREHPSSLNARDANGASPLLLAIYYQKHDIAKMLADATGQIDIFEARALGRVDRIKQLLREIRRWRRPIRPTGFPPSAWRRSSDISMRCGR